MGTCSDSTLAVLVRKGSRYGCMGSTATGHFPGGLKLWKWLRAFLVTQDVFQCAHGTVHGLLLKETSITLQSPFSDFAGSPQPPLGWQSLCLLVDTEIYSFAFGCLHLGWSFILGGPLPGTRCPWDARCFSADSRFPSRIPRSYHSGLLHADRQFQACSPSPAALGPHK